MKKKQRLIAILLAGVLLLSACGKGKPDPKPAGNNFEDLLAKMTEPTETPVKVEETTVSLESLRQTMAENKQIFAVAYLGYHHSLDWVTPVDPIAVMAEHTPEFYQRIPFLQEIPQDRILGEAGDLFCIIPLDADATVAVSKGYWDYENGQNIYDDMVYSSMSGEPLLVFCNNDGWEPDTQIYISGPSGEVFCCPRTDINGYAAQTWPDSFRDISPYVEMLREEQRELMEYDWVLPTRDQLIGTTWSWCRYTEDGTEHSCDLSIDNDFLSVHWNYGEVQFYQDAPWELTYEDDLAILTIDFGEFAGVLRYNLLYEETYGELYTSIDVRQEDFPIGWEPMHRYLTMTSIPDTLMMIGTWDLGWTEVEDDIQGAEPGSQIIEITTDYEGRYWISYINNERPDRSFYDQEMEFVDGELYPDCGNNQWFATVDYIGAGGTEYSLTMLPEGTLLLRQYWEQEGFRSVAHGWYTRLSDEDPYSYAISQGWRFPELWELMNSEWRSWLGYAMDLMEDSVSGDNGGWVTVYDVNENGAYTESYTGTWQYDNGFLYLSLVPKGNGYLVDDSFPVLMLDGELWIGRNANGTGLPYFYSDTLADVLNQPKG